MKRKWSDLSEGQRRALVCAGVVDGTSRVIALIDLARRPADQVRGNKAAWAAALVIVNSAGVIPLVYFLGGRRDPVDGAL